VRNMGSRKLEGVGSLESTFNEAVGTQRDCRESGEDMFDQVVGLKKRYRDGEQILGVSMPAETTKDRFDQILSADTYDYVSVDSQHSPYNEETLAAFCDMAAGADVFVQFRIKHTAMTYLVGNYLDLGPCGIEVPQVELESTADEAVKYFYYPQDGYRSNGGRHRRKVGDYPDYREYAKWWNTFGVLWLQVESVEAVTNAHKLIRAGVDCISFGPTDLGFSLDSHPNHSLKTVDDCIDYAVKSLEGTGVAVCHRTYLPELRQQYWDRGVQVILESPKG
jgi:2-keto-3-deoxy-L-rhamnonate aldolase RhmA